jgi:hypothetical protein
MVLSLGATLESEIFAVISSCQFGAAVSSSKSVFAFKVSEAVGNVGSASCEEFSIVEGLVGSRIGCQHALVVFRSQIHVPFCQIDSAAVFARSGVEFGARCVITALGNGLEAEESVVLGVSVSVCHHCSFLGLVSALHGGGNEQTSLAVVVDGSHAASGWSVFGVVHTFAISFTVSSQLSFGCGQAEGAE